LFTRNIAVWLKYALAQTFNYAQGISFQHAGVCGIAENIFFNREVFSPRQFAHG
jgi:hypothetical protein